MNINELFGSLQKSFFISTSVDYESRKCENITGGWISDPSGKV
jgi:hypothetical protein